MYTYMYVCMYVCMYLCKYDNINVLGIYVFIHIYLYVHLCIFMKVLMYGRKVVRMYILPKFSPSSTMLFGALLLPLIICDKCDKKGFSTD